MTNAEFRRRRTVRLVGAVGLPVVLMLGTAACSNDEPKPTATSSADASSDAKRAADALDEGLQAHAAGDLEAARTAYELTLKYDPTNKYAFYNLALLDEADGNYGLAEGNYRSALKTDPRYEPALFNLAVLRTARNDPDEAISLYKRAVKADKKDAAAWLNLGLLLRDKGRERDGDIAVVRAIALDPTLKDPAQG
jgi:tetratricopeptide (TPR) repeat protein